MKMKAISCEDCSRVIGYVQLDVHITDVILCSYCYDSDPDHDKDCEGSMCYCKARKRRR